MSIYTIGMRITMADDVSARLAAIASSMMGVHHLQHRLTRGFAEMRASVMGMAGILAGGTMIGGLTKLVDKGNEWVRITRNMTMAGVDFKENMAAQAKALQLSSKYLNMSSVDVLRIINDARGVFGSQTIATEHIEPLVQAGAFLRAYQGKEKGAQTADAIERELIAAIKSGEIANKLSGSEMAEHIRHLVAMKVAFGDQVKIGQYLTAQRAAGVALRNASDAFRYGMFPALVQEYGSGAGTMLMTAWNKVVAGTGNRTKSLERMAEIGLLNRDQLEYDKVGRIKGLKDPGAIVGSMDAAFNFGDWVMKTLKPRLDEATKGFTDPRLRGIREAQIISGMFPDRNAARAVTSILQQFSKLSKDAAMSARIFEILSGKGRMDKYLKGSWDYQTEAFSAQFGKLVTHLGSPAVARATSILGRLNHALAGMASWTAANPETAERLVASIGILGSVFAGAGALAILAAIGPGGWLLVGLAGFAAALNLFRDPLQKYITQPALDRAAHAGEWIAEKLTGKKVHWRWSDIKMLWESGASPSQDQINAALLNEFLARRRAKALGKGADASGPANQAVAQTGQELNHALATLPGQVQPAITAAMAAIGGALAAGIASIAGKIKGISFPSGASPAAGAAQKAAWHPAGGGKTITVVSPVNLDGKQITRVVSKHMSAALEHPRRAPFFDGMKSWTPGDMQTVTT